MFQALKGRKHTHTYMDANTCTHWHTRFYKHTHALTHVFTKTHAYTCTHVFTNKYAYAGIHEQTHAHTGTCIYKHTCIHLHTPINRHNMHTHSRPAHCAKLRAHVPEKRKCRFPAETRSIYRSKAATSKSKLINLPPIHAPTG